MLQGELVNSIFQKPHGLIIFRRLSIYCKRRVLEDALGVGVIHAILCGNSLCLDRITLTWSCILRRTCLGKYCAFPLLCLGSVLLDSPACCE